MNGLLERCVLNALSNSIPSDRVREWAFDVVMAYLMVYDRKRLVRLKAALTNFDARKGVWKAVDGDI